METEGQYKEIKLIFAGGLALAGIGAFVVTILKSTNLFVHGMGIPWLRVLANFFLGFILFAGGISLAYRDLPFNELLDRVKWWTRLGVIVLGFCYLARFGLVLLDFFSGETGVSWITEGIFAVLGLTLVFFAYAPFASLLATKMFRR